MSEQIVTHPGDIIQDSDGLLYLVSEVHGWGAGAVMRWREPRATDDIAEHYYRFKPGQYVVVGAAHMLPEAVAQARRDSLKLQREIEREAEREAAAKGK